MKNFILIFLATLNLSSVALAQDSWLGRLKAQFHPIFSEDIRTVSQARDRLAVRCDDRVLELSELILISGDKSPNIRALQQNALSETIVKCRKNLAEYDSRIRQLKRSSAK